jgi:hypothetical protein
MPIYRLIKSDAAFNSKEVKGITDAFEEALRSLQLVNRADPLAEIVTCKMIEFAKSGSPNPELLRDKALSSFDQLDRNLG